MRVRVREVGGRLGEGEGGRWRGRVGGDESGRKKGGWGREDRWVGGGGICLKDDYGRDERKRGVYE